MSDVNSEVKKNIPLPPPELLYQVSRDSNQQNFLQSSLGMVHTLKHNLSEYVDFNTSLRFLDFGCGVGKVLIGLREHENLDLYGCDVDAKVIKWCSENLRASTYQNNIFPPLSYPDNYFDVINAVSVFTHLNLEMQIRWAWELYRVLKPGGYLHFTVHGLPYFGLFAYVAKTRSITDLKIHSFEESELFMEIEQPIVDQLYTQKKGLDAQGQLEVAVAHTESVVRRMFSPFIHLKKIDQGHIGGGHDVYVLQKPVIGVSRLLDPFLHIETISGSNGSIWRIEFDLNNSSDYKNSIFRIFCTGKAPGTYFTTVESSIKIFLNNNLSTEKVVALSKGSRFFGDTNWTVVEVEMPALTEGRVSIELVSMPSVSSYLEGVKWLSPHIISRA